MGLVVFSLRSLVFLCILRFRIFKVRIFTLKSRGWGMKAHCYDRHPNGARHRSPMKSTVKKRINLQVSQQQLQIHTGSTAAFLPREDSSRDLLINSTKTEVYGYEQDVGCCNASLINSHARYNLNNGVNNMKSNVASVKNTTRKETSQNPRTRLRA